MLEGCEEELHVQAPLLLRDEGTWIDSSLAEPLLVSPCPWVMVPGRSPCPLPGRQLTMACQAWIQHLNSSHSQTCAVEVGGGT